jgi:hypothetical protein
MAKLAVFAVFRSEITAGGYSYVAESLAFDGAGDRRNSQRLAVPPLFFAVPRADW